MSELLTPIQWVSKPIPEQSIKSAAIKFSLITAAGLTLLIIGILANQKVEGLSSLDSEAQWGIISAGAGSFALYYVGFYLYHRDRTPINIQESVIAYCSEIKDGESEKYIRIWKYLQQEKVDLVHIQNPSKQVIIESSTEKSSNGYYSRDLYELGNNFTHIPTGIKFFWTKDGRTTGPNGANDIIHFPDGEVVTYENTTYPASGIQILHNNNGIREDRDIVFRKGNFPIKITQFELGNVPGIDEEGAPPSCVIRKYTVEIYPEHWPISTTLFG